MPGWPNEALIWWGSKILQAQARPEVIFDVLDLEVS